LAHKRPITSTRKEGGSPHRNQKKNPDRGKEDKKNKGHTTGHSHKGGKSRLFSLRQEKEGLPGPQLKKGTVSSKGGLLGGEEKTEWTNAPETAENKESFFAKKEKRSFWSGREETCEVLKREGWCRNKQRNCLRLKLARKKKRRVLLTEAPP